MPYRDPAVKIAPPARERWLLIVRDGKPLPQETKFLLHAAKRWRFFWDNCWMVLTARPVEYWTDLLCVSLSDSVLITEVNPHTLDGLLPTTVWDWTWKREAIFYAFAARCSNCGTAAEEWGGPPDEEDKIRGWCRPCGAFYRDFWLAWQVKAT